MKRNTLFIHAVLLTVLFISTPSVMQAFGKDGIFQDMPAGKEFPDTIVKVKVEEERINNADSATTILPDVEVEAQKYLLKAGRAEYTPSKKDKNLSSDPIMLLRHMGIPQLRVADNDVKTLSGEDVKYFINGHPAEKEDIQGMNMSDVSKIVYLDSPSDSKYLGMRYVVEFILKEYEYGGYTKLRYTGMYIGKECFSEALTSKFSYRRMTYDLFINPVQQNYQRYTSEGEETMFFDGKEVHRKITPLSSEYRFTRTPLKMRAVYNHGKTYISNSVGFEHRNISKCRSIGKIVYSGDVEDAFDYNASSPLKRISASWDGYLSAALGKGWDLAGTGYLYYTRNDMDDSYQTSQPVEINNDIKENTARGHIDINVTKTINPGNKPYVMAQFDFHTSDADYRGSSVFKSKFRDYATYVRAGYSFSRDKINGNIYAGVGYENNSINDIDIENVYPFGYLSINYNPNGRNAFRLYAQYSKFYPTGSMKNPHTIQTTEFFYIKGNPDLDMYPNYSVGLNYTWIPRNNLFFGVNAAYVHKSDVFHPVYEIMSERNGVLKTYENSGSINTCVIALSATLNLFQNRLRIYASPNITFNKFTKSHMPELTPVFMYLQASWYFGNCFISGLWQNSTKFYESEICAVAKRIRSTYKIEFGWGNGKVNAGCYAYNFFRTSWKGNEYYVYSPVYNSKVTDINTNMRCYVGVYASYTFGYGKKIYRGDELSGTVSGSQSVVNH